VHSEGENDLIERVRSEQDRRYFKYMIRTENMEQLKAIIQQQGGRP
jgi:DNA-binding MarR family transcriptional regulator